MVRNLSSLGLIGIEPYIVSVEVDCRRGMPGFDVVGLPDLAVKESRDRVKSAIQNIGYQMPNAKIVVNLAPADTRKIGSVYDLPILLALICAAGYEDFDMRGTAVIGEIGLSGEVRGLDGVLPMVLDAKRLGLSRVIVPVQNAAEAAVASSEGIEVLAAAHVKDVIAYFKDEKALASASDMPARQESAGYEPDLSDVKGQVAAKRAMEIAAAGGHNLLFIGPPGTGKSMLARRLPSILPEMTRREAIETTKIHSVAGTLPQGVGLIERRPFRNPHHTLSPSALVGGGSNPKPGDISLAHNGVLFLDEIPEFPRATLEVLRQPVEEGKVHISRVRQRLSFPSEFMLVVAMNPCPCGYFGHPTRSCTCSKIAIQKYLGRISGPLLDRIDIHVEVLPIDYEQASKKSDTGDSATIRKRVGAARTRQQQRYRGTDVGCNAMLQPAMVQEFCRLDDAAERMLKAAYTQLGLSARGYDRILKVALTIADLDDTDKISVSHISQAIQLRSLDRKYWQSELI